MAWACDMPGIVLSTLTASSHLILPKFLLGRYYYYSYFIDEVTETEGI